MSADQETTKWTFGKHNKQLTEEVQMASNI